MTIQTTQEIDELDLALVNALQINPRASWAVLGRTLDIDPATVARRWERLRAAGHAWVTAYPFDRNGAGVGAIVEIDCEPGHNAAVARALSADPQAITVEHTAGGRDLLLTLMAPSFADLSAYILERLSVLPGIRATRSHLTTRSYTEGSSWRLRSLDPAQQHTVGDSRRPAPSPGTAGTVDALEHRDLILALGEDGRMSLTDLAAAIGTSVNTAGRRLTKLIDSGALVLRCELARSLSGSPVSATFWAQVPPEHLDATARELAQLPEIRMIMGIAGPHNLVMTLWLRSVAEAQTLETRLAERLLHLRTVDRAIALRAVKLMGRLLDPEGRAIGFVPLDIWADPTAPGSGPARHSADPTGE
ncbi:Lrp/AsnC family transcriptional regulator [Embleya sp. AB8]|uniref:Lrp/AsnC family transcriptional regulator n=1 Tax=Embleya sp. AB8 TaxID=3156304 RepID=UPI003C794A86